MNELSNCEAPGRVLDDRTRARLRRHFRRYDPCGGPNWTPVSRRQLSHRLAEESLGLAQDYLKYCVKYAMVHNRADRATANLAMNLQQGSKLQKTMFQKMQLSNSKNQ